MDGNSTIFHNTGRVCLIGAGCEAGQLTQDGLRAIQEADVIVYDDLMDMTILAHAREDCELIPVGKRWYAHKKEQEEIHAILADRARKGKSVVRLKGGDPTVFGRGGEEYTAMREAGILCELVPGVSSCIAAPEHMGISVTHRGIASSFTVVTGHGAAETKERYEVLAALKGTLVFLMSLTKAEEIAEGLISAGKDPATPVSILSCVFREGEHRTDGTLSDLAALAKEAEAPAILVVGKTAGLHLRDGEAAVPVTAAMQGEPAEGEASGRKRQRTALIVGTASFTKKMAGLLREDGMRAIEYPCIDLVPQPEEIPPPEELEQYDWAVFTSANGVRVFADGLRGISRAGICGERGDKVGGDRGSCCGEGGAKADIRLLAGLKFACIGPGTAKALEEALFIRADLIPGEYTSEALARALVRAMRQGQKALLLRAAEASPLLTEALDREKIRYRDCGIYKTQYCGKGEPACADYVLFGSAGGARAFLREHALPENAVPVAIGKITKTEVEALTGRCPLTAEECTAEGIRRTLREKTYDKEGLM